MRNKTKKNIFIFIYIIYILFFFLFNFIYFASANHLHTKPLYHKNRYAIVMAFDVKVDKEIREYADKEGIKIFTADIIYHLFDQFTAYMEELKQKAKEEHKHLAVFPCRLKILADNIFNKRDPIVVGVDVIDGILKTGTPIVIPSKEKLFIGTVTGIQIDPEHPLQEARRGATVCIKIDNTTGDAPKMIGRHFDENDQLVSRVSIRVCVCVCAGCFFIIETPLID